MKPKQFLWIANVIALVMAAIWAGSAYASSSNIVACFTDTSSPYACWMKQNGFASGNLFQPNSATTRLQTAIWLARVAQIPPTTGLITISDGFGNWKPLTSSDPLTFSNFSNETQVSRTTAGASYLSLQPSIPTVLYGRSLQFRGVELCYRANLSAAITYVEINTFTHTTGLNGRSVRFSDATIRSDEACRYYVLPQPVTLTAEDGVNIFIKASWDPNLPVLGLGRTTFVFAPTGVRALNPTSAEVTTLQENGPQPDGLNTSAP